jgi:hypothetical protein
LSGATPAGKRRVREPLYSNSPSSATKVPVESIKSDLPQIEEQANIERQKIQGDPINDGTCISRSDTLDPFDWNNELNAFHQESNQTEDQSFISTSKSLNNSVGTNVIISSNASIASLKPKTRNLIIPLNKPGLTSDQLTNELTIISCKRSSISKKLCLKNDSLKKIGWTMKQIGPVTVKKHNEPHILPESIFRIDLHKGVLDKNETKLISISFSPLFYGEYNCLYHIKSNGLILKLKVKGICSSPEDSICESQESEPRILENVELGKPGKRTEIFGNAKKSINYFDNQREILAETPSSKDVVDPLKPLTPLEKAIYFETKTDQQCSPSTYQLFNSKTLATGTYSPIDHKLVIQETANNSNGVQVIAKTPINIAKGCANTNDQTTIYDSTPGMKSFNPALSVYTKTPSHKRSAANIPKILDFGKCKLFKSRKLYLKISNPSESSIMIKFAITGVFSIPARELMISGKSYIYFPILAYSGSSGEVDERLIIQKQGKTQLIQVKACFE